MIVRDRGDATILTVSGELDVASSPGLRAALDRVDPTPARRLVLDLAGLSFIDVTGLSLLVRAQQRALRLRSRLILINVPDALRRLLKLTGSTDLLDSIQEHLRDFQDRKRISISHEWILASQIKSSSTNKKI